LGRPQSKFFHDFSISGKSHELTLVLQQIKKLIFTNEFNPTHPHIVDSEHEYLLHHILYSSPTQIHMVCSKVNTNLEDLDDLKDLRNFTFKESEGTSVVKTLIQMMLIVLIPNP
jgi:hypothetical protein